MQKPESSRRTSAMLARQHRRMIRAMFALVAALPLAAAAPPGAELVVREPVVSATIHGMAARLRIDPGAPSIPVLNPDFARRAVLRGGMFSTQARVGPVRIRGRSSVVRINLGDLGVPEFGRRATWFEAPITPDADGTIGPGGIPAERIRFELREPVPGERSVALPIADFGWAGMGVKIALGGEVIGVQFSLEREDTLATASAGAAIAEALGGAFDGAADQMMVALAVIRPVRHLTLRDPLRVGPFAITGMLVRTADFGSVAAIPDADAPEQDPDEIVVTGIRRQTRQLNLTIGRDYLDRCSSIVFDKRAKTVTLTCR